MEKAVKSKKAMEKASPEALRLAQQQETKKPGRERASTCPDQSQVAEDAHEDLETDVHRMDHIKKARRSSFKKKLLPNKKSLLLEMDVSESSICESVNPVPSSKVQTPTTPSYEEVYRRENKKQIYDKKQMEKAAGKTVQAEFSSVSTFIECGRVWTSSFLQLPNANQTTTASYSYVTSATNERPEMIGPAISRT